MKRILGVPIFRINMVYYKPLAFSWQKFADIHKVSGIFVFPTIIDLMFHSNNL